MKRNKNVEYKKKLLGVKAPVIPVKKLFFISLSYSLSLSLSLFISLSLSLSLFISLSLSLSLFLFNSRSLTGEEGVEREREGGRELHVRAIRKCWCAKHCK